MGGWSLHPRGVAIGSVLNLVNERLSWRRTAKLSAGEALAEVYELIWAEGGHSQFVVHIMKLRVRLGAVGVDGKLMTEFEEAARDCFREAVVGNDAARELDDNSWKGIAPDKIKRLEAATLAIQKHLR